MLVRWGKTKKLHTVFDAVLLIVIYNWYTVMLLEYNPQSITLVKDDMVFKITRLSRPIKFILQWTSPTTEPFVFWGKGQEGFLKRKCKVNECFVTNNRALLRKLTDYDAIAFHGPELKRYRPFRRERSQRQKYVYVGIESSHYYPICNKVYDDFFNWTWTYRLDSDVPYAYIAIRDVKGKVIGPRKSMNWISVNSMKPISQKLKKKLRSKRKAVAWFASNCHSKSMREKYVDELQKEIQKYQLDIDVFGKCGTKKCPRKNKKCLKIIEKDYYFYMAMENSISEDYVTEKLLTALQNFAIPVVYGAANYTRFMPNGIYLDAWRTSPAALAKEMHNIINDKERFYRFFRWRNHYSYHAPRDSPDTDELCILCEMLHNERLTKKKSSHKNFRRWWNEDRKC